ncbi:MAG: hypothetical protein M3Z05_07440 [Gemmatimonadota bacterium]|nr:hypothetical protein [Gemmatimonadota bacterium]
MSAKKTDRSVREPVQVYMEVPDRALLERAAVASGLSRAEVLRRGLRRFAAEILADVSPALAFLESAAGDTALDAPADVAARHDDYLADWEMASWEAAPTPAKVARKRK